MTCASAEETRHQKHECDCDDSPPPVLRLAFVHLARIRTISSMASLTCPDGRPDPFDSMEKSTSLPSSRVRYPESEFTFEIVPVFAKTRPSRSESRSWSVESSSPGVASAER